MGGYGRILETSAVEMDGSDAQSEVFQVEVGGRPPLHDLRETGSRDVRPKLKFNR